jgi:Xaa-Pro aminopeptidase
VTPLLDAARVGSVLKDVAADAIVATTRENLIYAADYERTLLYAAGAPGAAIVTRDPPRLAALVVPRIEAGYLGERDAIPDRLVFYGDFFVHRSPTGRLTPREQRVVELLDRLGVHAPSFVAGVATALSQLGLTAATVAWDDVRVAQAIEQDHPRLRTMDGMPIWRRIRATKTEEEVRRLRRSAAINEAVEAYLIRLTRPGVDWRDIMVQFRLVTVQAGAEPGFWSAAPGPQSGFIYESMSHVLQRGDIVRYDFGSMYRHYWSDTGRTVVLGEPDGLTQRRYRALRAGIEEATSIVRPGTTYRELFRRAMDAIAKAGLPEYRRHHCGHAIGLQLYDGDYVSPTCDTRLETGMVLNLEVPYYELGWGGLQIEDTLLVTPTGSELLTTISREIHTGD